MLRSQSITPPAAATPRTSARQRPTVLVVDDESTQRALVSGILAPHYEVIQASDGEEGLGLAWQHQADLVVMDAQMPGLDGIQATMRLKEEQGDRVVPVLLMTAEPDEQLVALGLASGADDFIFMPCSPLLLLQKIRILLRTRDSYAAMRGERDQLAYFRERAEQDYAVTTKIFHNVLEADNFSLPCLRRHVIPVETFSGDVALVARVAEERFRVLVGDFAGHGLGAAIGAIPVADTFHAMARRGLPMEDVIREIAAKLYRIFPRSLFFSACFADIDLGRCEMHIWNGGMPEVLLVTPGAGVRTRVISRHLPLSIVRPEKLDLRMERVELHETDRILFCSDGLIETENPDGEMFGSGRLEDLISETAEQIRWADRILETVIDFRRNAHQRDDIAVLGITMGLGCTAALEPFQGDDRTPDPATVVVALERRLGPDDLRAPSPLAIFQSLLEGHPVLSKEATALYTVLAELFSNALEYGVLRLDSQVKSAKGGFDLYYAARERGLAALDHGWVLVRMALTRGPGEQLVRIRVEDSGKGFTPRELGQPADPAA